MHGHVIFVVVEKAPVQFGQHIIRQVGSVQFKGTADHGNGAVTDQVADLSQREFAETVIANAVVERSKQIGRRICQRAVEIEYDGEVPVHENLLRCLQRA